MPRNGEQVVSHHQAKLALRPALAKRLPCAGSACMLARRLRARLAGRSCPRSAGIAVFVPWRPSMRRHGINQLTVNAVHHEALAMDVNRCSQAE